MKLLGEIPEKRSAQNIHLPMNNATTKINGREAKGGAKYEQSRILHRSQIDRISRLAISGLSILHEPLEIIHFARNGTKVKSALSWGSPC
jgi:hypothetical protein